MGKFDYGTIVIGGGAAGLTSSIGSARMGSKTLLVEKEQKLGGDCLHYGCVPSKSLIKSAYCCNVLRHSQRYGLPKVEVPPVDFKEVRNRIRKIVDTIQEHDSPEFFKKQYNIDTEFGSPRFVDPHTITINGKTITAKRFILATGSAGKLPPVEGLKDVPFITNVDVFSLEKLPVSLIVLGGGPIGAEMAQAFCRLGSKVTIVEFAGHILPKEDEDVALLMESILKEEGIEVLTSTAAKKARKDGDMITLTLEHKGQIRTISAESVLVATGRAPNVEGLDLEKAGVQYTPQGIKVNNRLQTTAKNIFACGDCKGGFLFTHIAEYEARIALVNAFLPVPVLKTDYSKVPWCTYLDPEAASVGMNEGMAKKAGIEYKIYKAPFADVDRALAEGETKGFVKVLTDVKGKIIGVQMVGFHAGELIHQWITAINGKVNLSNLAQTIYIYPTLAQINKKVSGSYMAERLFNNPVLKLIRSFKKK